MAIGGKREGAGRKPKWGDRPTKKMLIPIEYEAAIEDFLRSLESSTEIKSEAESTYSIAQLEEAMNAIALATKPSERAIALKLFKKLLREICD